MSDATRTGPVVVLRGGVHGMPVSDYVAALRERLPDREVRHARTSREEVELAADAAVVTASYLPEAVLDAAADLRLFACSYAGYGHLPLEELAERGVRLTTASGVHAPNVAEHAVGAILHFCRGFDVARRRGERGEWRSFHTRELQGSTVTVVGLGATGDGVCERLEPFGVTTLGVRSDPSKGGPVDEVYGPDGFEDALARSEFLVLACPLTEATRGLVDEDALTTLPPDAVLVNVARGEVVDTDALVDALRSNELAGAALDVTDPEPLPSDHPLWDFGNVLVTPHNAGHTPEYYERLAEIVADNARQLGSDDPLRNEVPL